MSDADPNGLFQFTISYQDPVGNSGDNITNTSDGSLVTIDTANPQLDNITIASSNSVPSLANQNDTITLTFDTTEIIETPVVKILGYGADSVDQGTHENQWVATQRVNPGDDLKFLNEGLAAYYPLNGDAEDKIGNKDGVIEGPITSKDKYGRNEHSLSFDGVDDSIFINQEKQTAEELGLPEDNLTISGWVNLKSFGSWEGLLSFTQDNGAYEYGWSFGVINW